MKPVSDECEHVWYEYMRDPWTIYYRCRKCGAQKTEINPLQLGIDDVTLPPGSAAWEG